MTKPKTVPADEVIATFIAVGCAVLLMERGDWLAASAVLLVLAVGGTLIRRTRA